MGHIESKIKNFKGILRLFTPYFYWRVCHIKVQRHTLYTNYVFSYCPKYILQYSLFEHTPFRPIYLARSNDYWSIIIWLTREFVEFNRAYLEYMAIFEEASEIESPSSKRGSYGKYMEYPPPPPPRAKTSFGVAISQDNDRAKIHKRGILLWQLIAKSIRYLDQYLHFRGEGA